MVAFQGLRSLILHCLVMELVQIQLRGSSIRTYLQNSFILRLVLLTGERKQEENSEIGNQALIELSWLIELSDPSIYCTSIS